MRVAAIDQGTNTTRLLVADVEDGQLSEVVRRSTITRLGEGVDERRRLLPLPIARTRNCLSDYRREAERLGADRTLLYRGAVDNFKAPQDDQYLAYLEPALASFVTGRPIERPETASFGCAIQTVYYQLPQQL